MSDELTSQIPLSKLKASVSTNQKRFIFGLLVISAASLFQFIGGLSCFFTQYQTNDDTGMNMFAMGKGLAQQPSEFLLFQHFILGLTLSSLYSHLPGIPWYGISLYAYLILSSIVAGYSILRLWSHFTIAGLWIAHLLVFYLLAIVSPQFTICAGYLGISGILLLYSTLHKPYASQNINRCLLMAALGLIVLAGLIRFQSMLLVLFLMMPLYVNALVTHFAITIRRLLPLLCCVIFISVLLNWWQQVYYRHGPGWEQFYDYNNFVADFIDRGKITWNENTKPLFQQVRWSQNDLSMLQNWFYLDPQTYSFQNLSFLSQNASVAPQQRIVQSWLFESFKDFFSAYNWIAPLLGALLFLKVSGNLRIIAALAFLWYCCLFFGIIILERPPPLPFRVGLVMLFGFCVMCLVWWCHACEQRQAKSSIGKTPSLSNKVLIFLRFGLCIIVCWGCWKQVLLVNWFSNNHRKLQTGLQQDLVQLRPRPDQLFVVWGGEFPYDAFQLPIKAEPAVSDMQLLGLGVGNHAPFVQNRLKAFGIADLYQDFYLREDIFLISNEWLNRMLVQYIQEHYQIQVEAIPVFRGTTFTVYKVRKRG